MDLNILPLEEVRISALGSVVFVETIVLCTMTVLTSLESELRTHWSHVDPEYVSRPQFSPITTDIIRNHGE
jgi:hypothetical protein